MGFVGSVLFALGVALSLAGGLGLFVVFIGDGSLNKPVVTAYAASAMVAGVMYMGISQLLQCVRAMAINSFHLRNKPTA